MLRGRLRYLAPMKFSAFSRLSRPAFGTHGRCSGENYLRESKDRPSENAFCLVAPTVLFRDFAILPAGVFFFARLFRAKRDPGRLRDEPGSCLRGTSDSHVEIRCAVNTRNSLKNSEPAAELWYGPQCSCVVFPLMWLLDMRGRGEMSKKTPILLFRWISRTPLQGFTRR
jgi:hypothetical protein